MGNLYMSDRPELKIGLDGNTFRNYYYLKEELVEFCRENHLPTSGGKVELTERIAAFLNTGEVIKSESKAKKATTVGEITEGVESRGSLAVITCGQELAGGIVFGLGEAELLQADLFDIMAGNIILHLRHAPTLHIGLNARKRGRRQFTGIVKFGEFIENIEEFHHSVESFLDLR